MTEIALAAGFGSVRRFNHAFHTTYGRAPRELRGQRRDESAAGGDEVVLRLAYRPPYDWAQVRDFLATRALPGVERVDARGYARTVAAPADGRSADGGHAIVCVRALEHERALELRVWGAAPAALFQLSAAARRTFDLAADPARIALALRGDPLLAPLVDRRPGLRIPGAWDPFECAVRAVLGQQVSVAAGRTLTARVVARVGRPIAGGTDGLTHLFPSPAALAAANLDGLGLTGARARALRALAHAVAEGALDLGAPVEDVTAGLEALPGLGRWTAQYVALRALGEPDAFPAADLVLRCMAGTDGTPLSARALEARAEAWRPWRGYAVLHLWRAASDVVRPRRRADRVRKRPARKAAPA
jgi:AraC family transcriptional regulator of adaptative response / DNA-3-methyladenine glycosylase II